MRLGKRIAAVLEALDKKPIWLCSKRWDNVRGKFANFVLEMQSLTGGKNFSEASANVMPSING